MNREEYKPPPSSTPILVALGLGAAGLLYWLTKRKTTPVATGATTTSTTGTPSPKPTTGATVHNIVGSSSSTRPPIPQSIASQNIGQAGIAPEGYRIFSKTPVPDGVTEKCKELLGLVTGFGTKEFGYEEYATVDGKNYFFRIEPHYHPDDYPGGPHGWHKGCTVYEKLDIVVDQ
jgi:hypothetical protein